MEGEGGLGRLPEGPVRRMFEAIQRHDLDDMVSQFAEDFVNVTPNHPGRSFQGRAQVATNWAAIFAAAPDVAPTVRDVVVDGGGKVWVEWALSGTLRDGRPIEQAGVAIATVDGDKLASVRFYLEPVEHDSGDVNAAVRAAVASRSES